MKNVIIAYNYSLLSEIRSGSRIDAVNEILQITIYNRIVSFDLKSIRIRLESALKLSDYNTRKFLGSGNMFKNIIFIRCFGWKIH